MRCKVFFICIWERIDRSELLVRHLGDGVDCFSSLRIMYWNYCIGLRRFPFNFRLAMQCGSYGDNVVFLEENV